MTQKYAHTHKVKPWQTMQEHLDEVSMNAARFASAFDSGSWGELAGVWHDLGKYADDFQLYLRSSAGDPEVEDASVVDGWKGGRVDHSTAGAVLVHERCGENFTRMAGAVALAMVIGIGAVLMMMVTVCVTYSVSGLVRSKHDQDWNAAISAAYAGVADYQGRVTNDSSYAQWGNPAASFTKANNSQGSVTLPTGTLANAAFNIAKGAAWAPVPAARPA